VTLHIDLLHGENSHHVLEAIFKGMARAMHQAVRVNTMLTGALSSKGVL
jgi:imidazoleglycerol-phosphate dehydratase